MLVSLNFRAISAALLISFVGACKPAETAKPNYDTSYEDLSNKIGEIVVKQSSLEDLPGNTRAEKLLYQAGIVSQMQTAMLVMFDTQAKTIRLSGNTELANELTENRDIMMEAVNLELSNMIVDAGLLYEQHLDPEEIERLIVLHADPAMQKLILSQPKISQGMLPIGQAFGEKVGARYEVLSLEKTRK